MPGYTDPFGGSSVQPADVAYRAVALSANVTLGWPSVESTNYVARIMDVTASAGSLSLTMPDATAVSTGFDVIYLNPGAQSYAVKDAAGGTIVTVAPGAAQYIYLRTNATAAGTWGVLQFASLSSAVSAAALAGMGLQANGSQLQAAEPVASFNVSRTLATTDLAQTLVWTGGTGTLTVLAAATAGANFFVSIANQGTGTLTLARSGADTIDGATSLSVQAGESLILHSGGSAAAWYSVGRGRSTQFNFTLLTKSISTGTVTLTNTEAANTVQIYSGTLTGNVNVVFPSTVQVYYVSNQTTGAFSVTFKTAGVGSTVTVPTGQNAVLFCDGTNVLNSSTTVSGISSLTLNLGSAASPSISYTSDGTTGIYSPGTGQVAVTTAGAQRVLVNSSGLSVTGALAATGTSSLNGVVNVGGGITPGNYVLRALSTTGDRLRVSSLAAGSGAGIDVTDAAETTTARNLALGASNGTISVPGYSTFSKTLAVDQSAVNNTYTLTLTNTASNGAQVLMAGNGATTPNKTLRAFNGALEVVDSAYANVIWKLFDNGNVYMVNGTLGIGVDPTGSAFKVDLGTSGTGSIGGVANMGGFSDASAYSIWAGRSLLNGGGFQLYGHSHPISPDAVYVVGNGGSERARWTQGGWYRQIAGGSPAGDVAVTHTGIASDKMWFVDPSRAANSREVEWFFSSGTFAGRYVNDLYTVASNWVEVVGGSTGITSIKHLAGGSFTLLDSSGNFGIGAAPSAGQKLEVSGGMRIAGPAAAAAAYPAGIFSYDSPVMRAYVGDGSGYSWAFSKRNASVTTDLVSVLDSGLVGIGTTPSGGQLHVKSGLVYVIKGETTVARGSGQAVIGMFDPSGSKWYIGNGSASDNMEFFQNLNGYIDFYTNATRAFRITNAQRLEDAAGNELGYKGLPAASVTTGAFAASDRGKCVFATAGVTVPNATMSAGDIVVIQNTTASNQTITATITTLRQTGTTNTGNRTLLPYGRASILFESGTVGYISGDVT